MSVYAQYTYTDNGVSTTTYTAPSSLSNTKVVLTTTKPTVGEGETAPSAITSLSGVDSTTTITGYTSADTASGGGFELAVSSDKVTVSGTSVFRNSSKYVVINAAGDGTLEVNKFATQAGTADAEYVSVSGSEVVVLSGGNDTVVSGSTGQITTANGTKVSINALEATKILSNGTADTITYASGKTGNVTVGGTLANVSGTAKVTVNSGAKLNKTDYTNTDKITFKSAVAKVEVEGNSLKFKTADGNNSTLAMTSAPTDDATTYHDSLNSADTDNWTVSVDSSAVTLSGNAGSNTNIVGQTGWFTLKDNAMNVTTSADSISVAGSLANTVVANNSGAQKVYVSNTSAVQKIWVSDGASSVSIKSGNEQTGNELHLGGSGDHTGVVSAVGAYNIYNYGSKVTLTAGGGATIQNADTYTAGTTPTSTASTNTSAARIVTLSGALTIADVNVSDEVYNVGKGSYMTVSGSDLKVGDNLTLKNAASSDLTFKTYESSTTTVPSQWYYRQSDSSIYLQKSLTTETTLTGSANVNDSIVATDTNVNTKVTVGAAGTDNQVSITGGKVTLTTADSVTAQTHITIGGGEVSLKGKADLLDLTMSDGTATILGDGAASLGATISGGKASILGTAQETNADKISISGSTAEVTISGKAGNLEVDAGTASSSAKLVINGGDSNDKVTIGSGVSATVNDFGKAGTDEASIASADVTLNALSGSVTLSGDGQKSKLVFTEKTSEVTITNITTETKLEYSGIGGYPTVTSSGTDTYLTIGSEKASLKFAGTVPDTLSITNSAAADTAISTYTFVKNSADSKYYHTVNATNAKVASASVLGTDGIDVIDISDSTKVVTDMYVSAGKGADTIKIAGVATVDGSKSENAQYISIAGGSIYGGKAGSTLEADGSTKGAVILGGAGDDFIHTKGEVTITGGGGNDSISRLDTNDTGKRTIKIANNDGLDTIADYDAQYDTIQVVDATKVTFESGSSDNVTLKPTSTADGGIVIVNGKTKEINVDGHIYQFNDDSVAGFVEKFVDSDASVNAITGSSRNDSIVNTSTSNITINAGTGDDVIVNSAANVTINAGDGADTIDNNTSNVLINGDAGADSIRSTADNVTINAGGSSSNVIVTNAKNKVTITGGSGNDLISTIEGTSADDGTTGHQRYIIASDGADSIESYAQGDTLKIASDLDTSKFSISSENSSDVIITPNAKGSISLQGGSDKVITTTKNGTDVTEYYYIQDGIYGKGTNAFVTRQSVTQSPSNQPVVGTAGNDSIEVLVTDLSVSLGTGNDWVTSNKSGTSISAGTGYKVVDISGEAASITSAGQATIFSASKNARIDLSESNDTNIVEIATSLSDGTTTIYSGKGGDSIVSASTFSNGSNNNFTAGTQASARLIILDANGSSAVDTLDYAEGFDTLQIGTDTDTRVEWTAKLVGADGTTAVEAEAEKTDDTNVLLTATGYGSILLTGAASKEITLANGSDVEYIKFSSTDTENNGQHRFVNIITNATDSKNITGIASANNSIDNSGSGTEAEYMKIGTGENMTGANIVKNSGSNVLISLGSGTDSVYNSAENVSIYGGTGDDTITNIGTNVSIVAGTNDKDSILSDFGTIVLTGGDTLSTLTSADARTISVTGSENMIAGNTDKDSIYLEGANASDTNFALIGSDITSGIKITTTAGDVSLTSDGTSLKYNINDKIIGYGKDAVGGDKFIQVQTFDNTSSIGESNEITATSYTDSITADNANSDTKINLLDGNDILNINAGQITLGGGSNSLDVSSSATITGTSLSGGVDTITAGDSAVSVKGGAGSMYVKLSDNSTLTGAAGNDTIYGGENRTIIINGGTDTLQNYVSGYEDGAVTGGDTIIANLTEVPSEWGNVIKKGDNSDVSIQGGNGILKLEGTNVQDKTIVLQTKDNEVAYLTFDSQYERYVNRVQDALGSLTSGADIANLTAETKGTGADGLKEVDAKGGNDRIYIEGSTFIDLKLGAGDSSVNGKEITNSKIELGDGANKVTLATDSGNNTIVSAAQTTTTNKNEIVSSYTDGNTYLNLSAGNNDVSLAGSATKADSDADVATVTITLGSGENNIELTGNKYIRRYLDVTNASNANIDLSAIDTLKGVTVEKFTVSSGSSDVKTSDGKLTFKNASNVLITIEDNAENADGEKPATHQYAYNEKYTSANNFANVIDSENGGKLVGLKDFENSIMSSAAATIQGGSKADILALYDSGSINAGSGSDTIYAIGGDNVTITANDGTSSIISAGDNAVIDLSSGSGTVYAVGEGASIKAGNATGTEAAPAIILTGSKDGGTLDAAAGGYVSLNTSEGYTYQDSKGADQTASQATAKGNRTILLGSNSHVTLADYQYKGTDTDKHDALVFQTEINNVITPTLDSTKNVLIQETVSGNATNTVAVLTGNAKDNKIVITNGSNENYTFQLDSKVQKFVNYIAPGETSTGTRFDDSILAEDGGSVTGGEGNDIIKNYSGATIDGGAGDDIIVNSDQSTIVNSTGNDTIFNYGANSVIEVGNAESKQIVYNEAAEVSINAAAGENTIVTSTFGTKFGQVTINASAGTNEIKLESFTDNDWSVKKDGTTTLINSDTNRSNQTNNRTIILGGTNTIDYGEGDALTLTASGDNDAVLTGNAALNKISIGLSGTSDITIGGAGNTTLTGAATSGSEKKITINDNTYQYNSAIDGGTVVHLVNNTSDDGVDLADMANSAVDSVNNLKDNISINTGAGDDIIMNSGLGVSIEAGDGANSINSSGDGSTLIGGSGSDTIINSGANAFISVGAGSDTVYSSGNNTSIVGGNAVIKLVSYGNVGGDEHITVGAGDVIENVTNTLDETADSTRTTTYSRTFHLTTAITSNATIKDYNDNDLIIDEGSGAQIQIPETNGDTKIKVNTDKYVTLEKAVDTSTSAAKTITILNKATGVETSYQYTQGQYYYVINNYEADGKAVVTGAENGEIIKNYKAGSASAPVVINGGGNNDIIYNYNDNLGNATNVQINVGSGNDTITNQAANVTIKAEGGANHVISTGDEVLVSLGGGNDLVSIGGATNFSVDAGAGTNTIIINTYTSDAGNQAGTATITLSGGASSIANVIGDTHVTNGQVVNSAILDETDNTNKDGTAVVKREIYVVSEAGGNDTLENYNANDNIYFADAKNEISTIEADSGNVKLTLKDGGTFTFQDTSTDTEISIKSSGTTGSNTNDSLLFKYDSTSQSYRNLIKDTTFAADGSVSLTAFDDSVTGGKLTASNRAISLGGGDDYVEITNSNGVQSSIYAESGNNTIDATNFGYIEGGSGNDSIKVSGSTTYAVTINAGAGNDTIAGEQQKVVIVGQADGADVIESWGDNDIISVNADYGIGKADSITVTQADNAADGAVIKFDATNQVSIGGDLSSKTIQINDQNGLLRKVAFDNSETWNVIEAANVADESGTMVSINGTANHDSITATDTNINTAANSTNDAVTSAAGDRIYATASDKDVSVLAGSGNDSIVATGSADHKITVNSGLGDDTVDGAYRILQIEGNKTSNLLVQNFNSAQDTLQIIDNADDVTGISYTDVKVTAATRSSDGKEVYLEVGATSEHITLQSASAIDDTIGITDKAGNVVRTLQYNSSLDKFINIIDNVVVTDSDGNKVITGTSDIDSIRVATADVTVKDENTANNIVSIESAASNAVINLSSGADSIYAGAANASINAGGGADLIDITSATGASIFAGSSQSGQATITGFSNEATITTDKTDISTENIKGDETDATLTVGDNRELVISGMGAADKLIHVAQDGGTSLKTFTFDGTNAYNFIESAATSLGTSDNDSVVVTDGKDFDGSQGGNDRFILNGSASVTLGTGSNSVISGASNLTNTIILTGGNDTITDDKDAVLTINFNATNETAYIDKFSTNDLIVAGKLTGLDKASEITISDTATDNRYLMTIGENKAYFDSDTKAVKVMDSGSTATLKNYALDGGKWYNVIEEKNAKDSDGNLASIVGSTARDSITATNININTKDNVNTYKNADNTADLTDGDIINISGSASVITGNTYDTINTSGSDVISIVSGGNDLIDGTGTRYINATSGGALTIGTANSDDTIQVNVTGLNNAAQVVAEDADNTGDTKLTINGTQVMSIAGGASQTLRVADTTGESLQTIVKVDGNYYNYIEGANAADDTGAKVSIVGTSAQDSIVATDLDINVATYQGATGDIIEATATNSNVNITGGTQADTITAKGAYGMVISAGAGDDSIKLDTTASNVTVNAGTGSNVVEVDSASKSNVYIITPVQNETNTLDISSFDQESDRLVVSGFTGITDATKISATANVANKAVTLTFTDNGKTAIANVTLANAIDDSIKIYDQDNDDLVKVVKYNTNTSNFQNVIAALNTPQNRSNGENYTSITDSSDHDLIIYSGSESIDATNGGNDQIEITDTSLIKLGAGENTLSATDVIQIDVSAGTNAINATNTSTQTTISLTGGVNTLTLSGEKDTIISSNTTDTLTGGSARTISVSGSTNGAFTVTDLNTATDSDTIVTDISQYTDATKVQAYHDGTNTAITINGGNSNRTILAQGYNKSNILVQYTDSDGNHNTLKNLKFIQDDGADTGRYVNYINNAATDGTTNTNQTVEGTADDDLIENSQSATIVGQGGADSITNTASDVVIDVSKIVLATEKENDSIVSEGSNVKIILGNTTNEVSASGDENTIYGGAGVDNVTLSGSNGLITLGAGNDIASISGDNNTVNAGSDKNEIHVLGIGNLVNAGSGSDTIYTSKSANQSDEDYTGYITINAGGGNDTITADANSTGDYQNRIIQFNKDVAGTLYIADFDFGGGVKDGDVISLDARYNNDFAPVLANDADGTDVIIKGSTGLKGEIYLKGAKSQTIKIISAAEEGSTVQGSVTNLYRYIEQLDKFLPTFLNKNGSSAQDFVEITEDQTDVISASGGDDLVEVKAKVTLDAGKGADTVNVFKNTTGDPAEASVSGGDDNDVMINTADNVTIDGGNGNDLILNENAAATLIGGTSSVSGQDTIITTQYTTDGSTVGGNVTIMSSSGTEYVSNAFTSGRYLSAGKEINRTVDGSNITEVVTTTQGTDVSVETLTGTITDGVAELSGNKGTNETRTLVNNRTFYVDGKVGGNVVIEDYKEGDTIVVGLQSSDVTTDNYTKVTGTMSKTSAFGDNLLTFNIGNANVYLKNATDKKVSILEFSDTTKHSADSDYKTAVTTYQYAEGHGVVQVTEITAPNDHSFVGRDIADSIDVMGTSASLNTGGGDNIVNIIGNSSTVIAGADSDRITNLAKEAVIDAGGGQDNIYSHGAGVSIYAGEGANNIYLTQLAGQTPDETLADNAVTVGGGTQNDYIANTFFGYTVHADADNATMQSIDGTNVTRVIITSGTAQTNVGAISTIAAVEADPDANPPVEAADSQIKLTWSTKPSNLSDEVMAYNRVITYNGGVDEVADYHSTDRIVLTNDNYTTDKYKLTTSGTDAVLNIDGNNNKLTLKDATDKVITVTDASKKEIQWLYSGTEFMQVINIDSTNATIPANASPTGNADSINVGAPATVDALAGNDVINIDSAAAAASINAGDGADTVTSTADKVTVLGGADNDVLQAAGNEVVLDGGTGNDSLITALKENQTATIIANAGYNTIANLAFEGSNVAETDLVASRAISLGAGTNVITDFTSSDTLGGVLSANGIVTINNSDVKLTTSVTGSTGNTTLVGGRDKDISIISALDSTGRPALFRYYEADNKFVRVYVDDDLDNKKLTVDDNFNASISVATAGAEINASQGADYIWNSASGTADADGNVTSGTAVTINSGTNNDFIVNTGDYAIINADGGADTIISAANGASINGGADKDSIIAISYINPTLDSGSAVSVGAGATIEVGTENDYVGNVSDQVTLGTSTVEEKDSTGNVTNSYTLTTIASGRNDSVIIRTYKNNDFTTAESDDTYQANGGRTLDIKAATSGANTMSGFMANDTINVDTDTVTAKLNGRDVVLTFNKSTVTLTDASDKHIHIIGKTEDTVLAFVDGKPVNIVEDTIETLIGGNNEIIMQGSKADESINVTIQDKVSVLAGAGKDTVNVYTTLSADNAPVATIVGGEGDDVINLMNYNTADMPGSTKSRDEATDAKGAAVIVMSGSDGKDTVNYYDSTSELVFTTQPKQTATTSAGNVTFTVGNGSLTLTDAASKKVHVTVKDGDSIVSSTRQVYGTDTAVVETTDVGLIGTSLVYDASFNNAVKTIDASGVEAATGADKLAITGNSGTNTIQASANINNVLTGGDGIDVFAVNGKEDEITDFKSNETVIVNAKINKAEVSGSNVILSYGDSGKVTIDSGVKVSIVATESIANADVDGGYEVSSAIRYYDGTKATLIANANSSDKVELEELDAFDVVNASARKTAIAISASDQTKAVTMTGGSGNDSLEAGNGGGQLNGGSGNDTLVGSSTDNLTTMTGGAGNDVFAVNGKVVISDYAINQDYISLGGSDEAELNNDASKSGLSGSKNVTLDTGNAQVTIVGGATKRLAFIQDLDLENNENYSEVENGFDQTVLLTPIIQTSASVKSIQALNADGASTRIYDARVNAARGVTSIDASKRSYDNIIYVNQNEDVVVTVKGGTKADTIIGSSSDNYLTGGNGADVFVYSGGHDTITDYTPTIDQINVTTDVTKIESYEVEGSNVIFKIDENNSLTIVNGKNKDINITGNVAEEIKQQSTFIDVKEYIYTKPGEDDVVFGSAIETVNAAKVTNTGLKYNMEMAKQGVLYTGSGKNDSIKTSAYSDTIKTAGGNDTILITGAYAAGDKTFTYNNTNYTATYNATTAQDAVVISDYTAGKDVIQLGTYTDSNNNEVNDYISGIATVATSVTSGKKTTVTKDLELTTASGRTVLLTSKNTAAVTLYDNNYGEYKVQAKKSGSDIVTTLTLTAKSADDITVDSLAGYATINGSGLAKTKSVNITGSANTEWIKGGKGNDTLASGGGNDTLTGGAGSDVFKIASLTDGATLTVSDYTAGQDVLQLASTIAVVNSTIAKKNVQLTLLDTDTSAKSTLVLTNGKGKQITVTDIPDENGNADTSTIIYGEGYATLKPNNTTITTGDATTNPRYNLVKAIDVSASKATGQLEAVANNVNDSYYGNVVGLGTILKGGSKADTLVGSNNDDTFTGGSGNDVFVRGAGSAAYDVITDYAAGDVIDVASLSGSEIKGSTLAGSITDTNITSSFVGLTNNTQKKTPILQVAENGYIQLNNASGKKVTITDVKGTFSLLLGDGATLQPAATDLVANGITPINAEDYPNYVSAIDASKATAGSRQVSINGGNWTDNVKANMLLKGGAYADTIISSSGSDTMTGGKGNDVFVHGGSGNGTGNDVITDYTAGQDVISLSGGAKSIDNFNLVNTKNKDVELVIGSGKVVVQNGAGKKIKLSDQPAGIIFGANSSSATLSVTTTDVNSNGRVFADYYEKVTAIDGSAVAASAGGLVLTGNSHDNIIKGSKGADYISSGGGSYNTMTGGAGNDTFSWAGSSDDTITDYANGDVIEFTGGGQSNYTVETSGTLKNAVIFDSGSNKLTVLNGKNKKFTFGDGSTQKITKSSDAAYIAPTVEIVEDTTYEADLTSAVKAADTTTTVTSATDTADTVASAAAYAAPVINAVEAQDPVTPTWFTADDTLTADESAVSNLVDTSTAATTDLAVTSTPTAAVDPTSLTTSTNSDLATTSLATKKSNTK